MFSGTGVCFFSAEWVRGVAGAAINAALARFPLFLFPRAIALATERGFKPAVRINSVRFICSLRLRNRKMAVALAIFALTILAGLVAAASWWF